METTSSVSILLQQLRSDEPGRRRAAYDDLWDRYARRLERFASQRLNHRVRRRVDEQDVVNDVFLSLWKMRHRNACRLKNHEELWKLLVTIALRRISNTIKFHGRARRDYRREEQSETRDAAERGSLPHDIRSTSLNPAAAAAVRDEWEHRMSALPPELRQVVLWKIAGFTNEEIARPEMLDCAVRTVERKLQRIRAIWQESVAM